MNILAVLVESGHEHDMVSKLLEHLVYLIKPKRDLVVAWIRVLEFYFVNTAKWCI